MLVAAGRAAAEEDGGAVGKAMVEPNDAIARLWGDGCRLCGRHSVSKVGDQEFKPREPDRTSKAAGCVR